MKAKPLTSMPTGKDMDTLEDAESAAKKRSEQFFAKHKADPSAKGLKLAYNIAAATMLKKTHEQ